MVFGVALGVVWLVGERQGGGCGTVLSVWAAEDSCISRVVIHRLLH